MRIPFTWAWAVVLAGGVAAAEPPGEAKPGPLLFRERCSVCHGEDGRGAPGRAMFQRAMPDFTDCAFASREPDGDWMAVIHDGGPARGFSPIMPAQGGTLSERDLRAILLFLRSRCTDKRWPRGELNLPRPLVTEKAFPDDEAIFATFANTDRDGEVRGEFLFEKRIGPQGQLEASLPVVGREAPSPSSQWKAGVGDVAVGAKYAFFHRLELGSIASLGGEVVFPTGRESDGLGKGSVIFEPYLAAGQILPWDAFLQVQLLGEIPVDSDVSDELQLRTALGRSLRFTPFGRALSPMLEILGTWEFRPRGGSNADWDLVPQIQIPLNRRQHVRLDIGVRIPLTDSSNRPTQLGFYLLWDWYDGGFFDGW